MLLSALTDDEFLRHAQAEHDPILCSPVESEMLRRFGPLIDELEANDGLLTKLNEYGITEAAELGNRLDQPSEWDDKPIGELTDALDAGDMTHALLAQALALQNVCLEFDIDAPGALRKVLERDAKVHDILQDITQPINTLAALVAQD